ncbi:MAG: Na+/H+ antiporter NhaC family protein, partial [Oscillospiraceae bacterium]
VVGCILINIITASQYMSIILGGRLFIGEFKKKDMLPQTLSRCLEDGGTVTSLIVPWNVDGAFAAATLGVAVEAFLPFAVFNWVVPIVAITFGFLGKFQWKTGEIKSVRTYKEEQVA